jgi:hypothetical protein
MKRKPASRVPLPYFKCFYIDLDSASAAADPEGNTAAKNSYRAFKNGVNWVKLTKDPGYTLFADGMTALSALLRSEVWRHIVQSEAFTSVTDLGVGGGEMLTLIGRSVQPSRTIDHIVAVDISEPMLRIAFCHLLDRGVPADGQSFKVVRLDFCDSQIAALREHPELRFYAADRHVFFLLGLTFANFDEAELTGHLMQMLQPGDLLIIGVECWRLADGRQKPDADLLAPYECDAYIQYWIDAKRAEWKRKGPIEIRVAMEADGRNSTVAGAKTIVTSAFFKGQERPCTKSSRYDEAELVRFWHRRGLATRAAISSPRNEFYRLLVLERGD